MGTDPETGQPITTTEWIDRLAPKAWRSLLPDVRNLRRHSRDARQSTGAWDWPIISAGIGNRRPVFRSSMFRDVRFNRTTSWKRCSTCFIKSAGLAPMIPLDDKLRPTWLFGKTVHEGCDRAGYYEQGDFAHEYGSPKCLVKIGCWGPVVNCNVPKRGWMARHRWLPERGRHLHRLHDARIPRQVHAVHGRAAGRELSHRQRQRLRRHDSHTALNHQRTVNKEPKWRHTAPNSRPAITPTHYARIGALSMTTMITHQCTVSSSAKPTVWSK